CCTVADDFVPTIEKLLGRAEPPDHIVIETSGLALPQPLIRAFNWPEIRTKVTVDGVVTVVDGPAASAGQFAHDPEAVDAQRAADESLDHETPLAELFEDQLACADMIVVSKTDTMGAEAREGLEADLASRSRTGVRLVPSTAEGLGPDLLLGLEIGAESDLAARHEIHHHHDHDHNHDHHLEDHDDNHHHHHDHGHDEFESFVVSLGEVTDPAALQTRIADAIATHRILRLKGFAAIAGKPMRQVIQAVGPRIETYFDRPFGPDPRETRLVVIGLHGLDKTAIETALSVQG
ncbi:MAG: GTP-binding protein, partial [Pseudomonadota bacterium]